MGLLILALTAAWSGPAAPSEGLFLSWNDCPPAPGSASNLDALCQVNVSGQALVVAFTLAQAIDDVVAVEITIDVQHAQDPMPPWWRFAPGGCREGALSARSEFTGSTCVDFWQGHGTSSPPVTYEIGQPRGQMSQARIVVAIARAPTEPVRLEAGPMYYAAEIEISNERTSLCSGCAAGACLVLNSLNIGRLPGAPGGDYFVQQAGSGNANWATWQGGGGASCMAVPVRRQSWGRLKSLYR